MSSEKKFTVAVLGAAGGIGQPLSLLLKNSDLVGKLVLFDVIPLVEGVAADLSHIETSAEVVAVTGSIKDKEVQKSQLEKALKGVDVAVIPAGVPRKPGMSRDDLFKINAGIVQGLFEGIAKVCPQAMCLVISNPVNSTVPIAAETLKKHGVFDAKRLFGVSTLDIVRSNTFVAKEVAESPLNLNVRVIGGHSGESILPLLSEFKDKLDEETIQKLTKRIQTAGTEVVEAKAGAGSATLSMAYAGARFAKSVMKAMNGEKGVIECAYVQSSVMPGIDFFASPIELGLNGIEKIQDLGPLSDFEKELLETKVTPALQTAIQKGVSFVQDQSE